MSPEIPDNQNLSFGEKLLGMEGFTADRAKRYRAELETLLLHRLTKFERWTIAIDGIVCAGAFVLGGIAMAFSKDHPEFPVLDQARLTMGATCAIAGVVIGAWLLRIAIQGGYRRRLGDFMGLFITLLLCGGWGFALFDMAWDTSDPELRTKLLLAGGTLVLLFAASIIITHFQRLHRQTQEKLLRIEYHLAELMERNNPPSSSP
jgi:hypothetical protein